MNWEKRTYRRLVYKLRNYLSMLPADEQKFICQHCYDEILEVELRIIQQAISKLKKNKVELRKMLEICQAAEKSTVYLIGILILALKMALYQFFKFKSL